MKFKYWKIFATVAMIGLTLGASHTQVQAKGISSLLPGAGVSVDMDEAASVSEVKDEVMPLVSDQISKAQDETIQSANADAVWATVTPQKEIVEIQMPETHEDMIGDELEEDFTNLVIAQVDNYVNVRDYPDEETGQIVGKLYDNSVGTFIEESNGWYKIQSGNCTGYVKGEYCVTGEEAVEVAKEVGTVIATVTTTTLKVREEPDLESSVLGLVPIDDQLIVTEKLDGWVQVDIEEGYGYVSTDYVTIKTEFVTAESKEEEEARLAKEKEARDKANAAAAAKLAQEQAANADNGGSSSNTTAPVSISGSGAGTNVVNYALQFVGNPYVYGGSSLTNGTDCSGFVMSVYANFGVSLPHSSSGDRSVGYDVGGLENAQPGDIVCYSGHVGIYIGNGQIVHASTPKTGIIVGSATYRTPLCVRRIF